MYAKRYCVVFALCLLGVNLYTIYPIFEVGFGPISCPAYVADLSYQVNGSASVVGSPLYSETQILMKPGSVAYETDVYNSLGFGNNLTSFFISAQFERQPVTQYLYELDFFSGETNIVAANQTGITMTFQNVTFEGIYVAKILWKIVISNSANPASYILNFPCVGPGLVLTIGSIPYIGPLPYGSIQLAGLILNNTIGLATAAIICMSLKYYWVTRREKKGREG